MVSLHGLSEFSTYWGHTARLTFLCGVLQLTEEIGKLEDKVECANNALKADWERWKQNMQNDLKSAFTDTAEENIRYYEQVSRGSRKPFLVKRCALGCLSALSKDSRGKSQLSPSKASLVTSCWVVSLPHSTCTLAPYWWFQKEWHCSLRWNVLTLCLLCPFLCLSPKEFTKEEEQIFEKVKSILAVLDFCVSALP